MTVNKCPYEGLKVYDEKLGFGEVVGGLKDDESRKFAIVKFGTWPFRQRLLMSYGEVEKMLGVEPE